MQTLLCVLGAALWLVVCHLCAPARASVSMKRLYEDLFADYNRLVLPVATNKSRVTVTLSLKLGQILDLNLKQQILSTNVWVEQQWHDYKLQWDPAEYEGIDMIHVPAENIWIPDIVLLNNADGNYELTLVAKARLFSNGTVVWKPPTMFRSTCEIDVEFFPFDVQTCYLRFGSWTYAGDEVELRHAMAPAPKAHKIELGIDLSQFYKNVEWDVIEVPAYYNEVHYECCEEPFPDMTFKIVIRRKMLFYLVNLILPVAFMMFMTVAVFYLPSDSNEKVTLSISILTSLIVFFLLMLEIIPATSLAVPLFGKFLLFTMMLVSLSACVSVYVLNIYHRSPSVHEMSPRVRRLFLKTLPRLLSIDRPDPRERSSLNRFRRKKIAQQMLQNAAQTAAAAHGGVAHGGNKVYDLAQPLAASINLIETLTERNYERAHLVDDLPSSASETATTLRRSKRADDEAGRYFRRYVDNYIQRVKERPPEPPVIASDASQEHRPCCACRIHPLGSHHMPTDDTLDMTFDYEDQDEAAAAAAAAAAMQQNAENSSLPSPPPPPRPVTHLSNLSLHLSNGNNNNNNSGRLSRSSTKQQHQDDEDVEADDVEPLDESEIDHGQLVDKLISSIQMLEHDDVETTSNTNTTTTSTTRTSSDAATAMRTLNWPPPPPPPQQASQTSNTLLNAATTATMQTQYHTMRQSQDRKCTCQAPKLLRQPNHQQPQQQQKPQQTFNADETIGKPSDLLLSLRLAYDQMPPHVRAAIRSILFIADTIKNEDDENSAIEDWESVSMVVDRLFLWIFLLLCTFGSLIILALAPSLYDQRAPIDDKLRIDIPPNNCSLNLDAHLTANAL